MRRFALLTALLAPILIVALLPGCGGKSTSSTVGATVEKYASVVLRDYGT